MLHACSNVALHATLLIKLHAMWLVMLHACSNAVLHASLLIKLHAMWLVMLHACSNAVLHAFCLSIFYQEIDHMTWNGCKQTLADFVYGATTTTSIQLKDERNLRILMEWGYATETEVSHSVPLIDLVSSQTKFKVLTSVGPETFLFCSFWVLAWIVFWLFLDVANLKHLCIYHALLNAKIYNYLCYMTL